MLIAIVRKYIGRKDNLIYQRLKNLLSLANCYRFSQIIKKCAMNIGEVFVNLYQVSYCFIVF